MSSRAGSATRALPERWDSSMSASSPNASPAPSVRTTCSPRVVAWVISTVPSTTTKSARPGVALVEDDISRGVGLLEEPRRQATEQAARQAGEERRVGEEGRAPCLLTVHRPREPPGQSPLRHGAH